MPGKFVIYTRAFRIRYSQYYCRFYTSSGRYEYALRDLNGDYIRPAVGAEIVNSDEINNESGKKIAEIWNAANRLADELREKGLFEKDAGIKFSELMDNYIKWRENNRNDPDFEKHSIASITKFGSMRLISIEFDDVQKWIDEELAPKYAHNTVKHKITCAKSAVNWLIKHGKWKYRNPFAGHEWKATGQGRFIKSTISPEEWSLARGLFKTWPGVEQVMTLAYYTGLRPSEVYRIKPEDFNHENLMLTVHVQKTGRYDRIIAIPRVLSTWALNWKWVEINESSMRTRINSVQKQHYSLDGLTMETFRRNYISVMELAGCPLDHVDAHQGRYQSSVAKKHYLRDRYRAYKLMQPFIVSVFEGDAPTLVRLAK